MMYSVPTWSLFAGPVSYIVAICRSQTLSAQKLIALSIAISARTERVWWLNCQNLVQHSLLVWWVLSIVKEVSNVIIVNLQFHWEHLFCKVIHGLQVYSYWSMKNAAEFCCIWLQMLAVELDRCSKTVWQSFLCLTWPCIIFLKTDFTNKTVDWQWRHSTPLWKYLTLVITKLSVLVSVGQNFGTWFTRLFPPERSVMLKAIRPCAKRVWLRQTSYMSTSSGNPISSIKVLTRSLHYIHAYCMYTCVVY